MGNVFVFSFIQYSTYLLLWKLYYLQYSIKFGNQKHQERIQKIDYMKVSGQLGRFTHGKDGVVLAAEETQEAAV